MSYREPRYCYPGSRSDLSPTVPVSFVTQAPGLYPPPPRPRANRSPYALDAAKAIDRRAKRDPELLAKYQRTREYRSEIAKKALKTKEKNAAEHAAGANDTPAQPAAPPTS